MSKNLFRKVKEKYLQKILMSQECHRVSVRKNLKRFMILSPILAIFGFVMSILVLFWGVNKNNFTGYLPQIIYYGCFTFLGIIGFIWTKIVSKKTYVKFALKQIIPFWICTIGFQILCIYNIKISRVPMIGILAWITMLFILVLCFDINPLSFIIDIIIQIAFISIFVINLFQIEYLNLFLLIVLSIFFCFMQWKQSINNFNKEDALEIAEVRASNLLLNILPQELVDDINNGIRSTAKANKDVSIIFIDIYNYWEISKKVSPKILIDELNNLFANFDLIMEKYDIYRVKTMGYSYLAACGLFKEGCDNSKNVITAGFECLDYVKRRNKVAPLKWEIRIGTNIGNIISGIVGARKYNFDIFGDAVNYACIIGKKAESMKLAVSENLYERTKSIFSYIEFSSNQEDKKDNSKVYYADENIETLEEIDD